MEWFDTLGSFPLYPFRSFYMKAFRNFHGDVCEIDIDVGADGVPILPPDTTVDPRPETLEGHYTTVVGNAWVQIERAVLFEVFETKQQRKIAEIGKYRNWYTEQPVDVNGVKFDADDQARTRLTQALVINTTLAYLPPAWITYDNSLFPLAAIEDLVNLVAVIHTAFATRFFECNVLRQAAMAATDEAALDAVVIPVYGRQF